MYIYIYISVCVIPCKYKTLDNVLLSSNKFLCYGC